MEMAKFNQLLYVVVVHLAICLLLHLSRGRDIKGKSLVNFQRELLKHSLPNEDVIQPYDQFAIQTLYFFEGMDVVLLVFDGNNFKTFSLGHDNLKPRDVKLLRLVVDALRKNQGTRFQPGQPVFQMVLSFSSFMKTFCANEDTDCPVNSILPPILSFSSVYQDKHIFPTAKSFPNPEYSLCMYHWKMENNPSCLWIDIDRGLDWEFLKNEIIWRGSDQPLLPSLHLYKAMNSDWLEDEFSEANVANRTKEDILSVLLQRFEDLTPRWKAVVLTLKHESVFGSTNSWINASFVGEPKRDLHRRLMEKGLRVSSARTLSITDMSRYKYHIDLAGDGGTSWVGTLTKLSMPGLLFHHETMTKDWFFDLMQPWVHYVPVQTDLSDLRVKFQWAEDNEDKAKDIAIESRNLGEHIMSVDYFQHVYDELYIDYLGKVVQAYNPIDMSWEDCMKKYDEAGIRLLPISDISLRSKPSYLPMYSQNGIQSLYFGLPGNSIMLLVFDGVKFRTYALGHWTITTEYVEVILFLVSALESRIPERFLPGQPIFQMVFSVSEISTECTNAPQLCPVNDFYPPIISFSSTYRDRRVLPTAIAFPNPYFIRCMYNWKLSGNANCVSNGYDEQIVFEDLENVVIWRGSDNVAILPFSEADSELLVDGLGAISDIDLMSILEKHTNELTVRWKAVLLSLKSRLNGDLSWLDVRFVGESSNQKVLDNFAARGMPVSTHDMDSNALSRYKYHIDFGGIGGTSGKETLHKLLMPGVLFLVDNPMKDWFYDLMEPWVHYIPVNADLLDIRSVYEWAERNQERVKLIAQESTKLAKSINREEYMQAILEDYFKDDLIEVVKAYDPEDKNWEESLIEYSKNGIHLEEVSECSIDACATEWKPGVSISLRKVTH